MEQYSTKQRRLLLNFLSKNADIQFSVDDISEKLSEKKISKSAVYRNINKMTDEGIVERFIVEGSKKLLYQYVGDDECLAHLHLKCGICGTITHADCNITGDITKAASCAGFTLDRRRTMLFGVCSSCGDEKKTERGGKHI